MKTRNLIPFIGFALVLSSVPLPAPAEDLTHAGHDVPKARLQFDRWLDAFSSEWMRGDPIMATIMQYFEGPEQDALDRQLTPITKDFRDARVALAQCRLAELASFDISQLSPQQRISAALLNWQLDEIICWDTFLDHDFLFQHLSGLQVGLIQFMTRVHPIRNRRDIENYLARLKLLPGQIDEGIAQAKERSVRGILPPDFILKLTIAQLDSVLAGKPSENVLVTSLIGRMANLKTVTAEDKAKFTNAADKTVDDSIIPAFRRARGLLQEQLALAGPDAGLWRFPDGGKLYAKALRHFTTTEMTADHIHQLGLDEVKRIEAEMDVLLCQLGSKKGGVQDRMDRLTNESRLPLARPELLARYQGILRDAEHRSGSLFDIRPKAQVEVRAEPSLTENTWPPHYELPARDGSRPGVVYVPLPKPTFSGIGERTLLYHEGVPGHHFQLGLQNEDANLPQFRRCDVFGASPAYIDGWALYAERLAAESGWYDGDVKGRLGELNSELFRAKRLVVDTGLHARRWSRQQAIDYGIPASEVERYVVWPGQACAYAIGMLKILELRDKVQRSLGDKFSLKDFHHLVLRAGQLPLEVLDTLVADYIRDHQ